MHAKTNGAASAATQAQQRATLTNLAKLQPSFETSDAPIKLAKAMAGYLQKDGSLSVRMAVTFRIFPSELVDLAKKSQQTGQSMEEILAFLATDNFSDRIEKYDENEQC